MQVELAVAVGDKQRQPGRATRVERGDASRSRAIGRWNTEPVEARTALPLCGSFLVEQPDLNWRNPEVERRMHDVLRFWMERGVDGFRIDVMDRIVKDPELRDNPPEPDRRLARLAQTLLQQHTQDKDWPDIIDFVRRIRTVVDEFPERMTVGEVFGAAANIVRYYGGDSLDGLHLAFNFPLVRIFGERWNADERPPPRRCLRGGAAAGRLAELCASAITTSTASSAASTTMAAARSARARRHCCC